MKYSQTFTLKDIFNNRQLRDKIPLVNYREIERENGRISRRTNMKTVNREVFDTATSSARPFYHPLITQRAGDTMIISGNLVGDYDTAVDKIYNDLLAKKRILAWTANDGYVIRDALKESEKNKKYGLNSKLYLRIQSMQQVKGMTQQQVEGLLDDIMQNILYGDDFPQTQKKYNLKEMKVASPFDYEERKKRWRQKVGY